MKIGRYNIRVLLSAEYDSGYAMLNRKLDLPVMLSFVERLDAMGWLPPDDDRASDLCAAHGVLMHRSRGVSFYEFCATGMRYEREPFLTLFFHFDKPGRIIRICGVEPTRLVDRQRRAMLAKVGMRVLNLVESLGRQEPDHGEAQP
jgi:hypothetical protein